MLSSYLEGVTQNWISSWTWTISTKLQSSNLLLFSYIISSFYTNLVFFGLYSPFPFSGSTQKWMWPQKPKILATKSFSIQARLKRRPWLMSIHTGITHSFISSNMSYACIDFWWKPKQVKISPNCYLYDSIDECYDQLYFYTSTISLFNKKCLLSSKVKLTASKKKISSGPQINDVERS